MNNFIEYEEEGNLIYIKNMIHQNLKIKVKIHSI